MAGLGKVSIRHAALSGRIVLARLGEDPSVALETRDAMNEFWKALISFAFDAKMPGVGAEVDISFGGGDEQFVVTVKRLNPSPDFMSETIVDRSYDHD